MTAVLQSALQVSISASVLIVLVLLIRTVLRKCRCSQEAILLLYVLVALRLALPFTIRAPFGAIPVLQSKQSAVSAEKADAKDDPARLPDERINDLPTDPDAPSSEIPAPQVLYPDSPAEQPGPAQNADSISDPVLKPSGETPRTESPSETTESIPLWQIGIAILYGAGVLAMLLYCLASYLSVARRIRTAVRVSDKIYASDEIATAFVFGLFRPRILIPAHLAEPARSAVLAHEESHLLHRDHIYKFLAFLLLTLHWFNPFAWAAFLFFAKDLEFACDERVIKKFSDAERRDYAEALLLVGSGNRFAAASPISFSAGNVKERVRFVSRYRRPVLAFTILIAVSSLVLGACFLTNRDPSPASDPTEDDSPSATLESSKESGKTAAPANGSPYPHAPGEKDYFNRRFVMTAGFSVELPDMGPSFARTRRSKNLVWPPEETDRPCSVSLASNEWRGRGENGLYEDEIFKLMLLEDKSSEKPDYIITRTADGKAVGLFLKSDSEEGLQAHGMTLDGLLEWLSTHVWIESYEEDIPPYLTDLFLTLQAEGDDVRLMHSSNGAFTSYPYAIRSDGTKRAETVLFYTRQTVTHYPLWVHYFPIEKPERSLAGGDDYSIVTDTFSIRAYRDHEIVELTLFETGETRYFFTEREEIHAFWFSSMSNAYNMMRSDFELVQYDELFGNYPVPVIAIRGQSGTETVRELETRLNERIRAAALPEENRFALLYHKEMADLKNTLPNGALSIEIRDYYVVGPENYFLHSGQDAPYYVYAEEEWPYRDIAGEVPETLKERLYRSTCTALLEPRADGYYHLVLDAKSFECHYLGLEYAEKSAE